jgi:hypothetical protein
MQARTAVFRYLSLGLPAAFLLTSSVRIYSFFHQRPDIWWTPRGAQVPLAESHDRVAIYVAGAELDDLVAAGRLRLQRDQVASAVAPHDVAMRFNNWDRVRAQQLPAIVIAGVTAGAAAALLMMGLILTLVERPPRAGGGRA